MAAVAEKVPEIMFRVSPLLVRITTRHSTTGRPMIIPLRCAASGLLFFGKPEARRFSPRPFVVLVILAVSAVLLLAYLIAKRWLQ